LNEIDSFSLLLGNISSTYAETIIVKEVGLHSMARAIFQQALVDCGIERAFTAKVKALSNGGHGLLIGDYAFDFARAKVIRIVAIGKAGRAMFDAILPRLPISSHCDLAGVLIAPDPPAMMPPGFRSFAGGHPFPNAASFAGAKAVLDMLEALPSNTPAEEVVCLFLVSGGASAMMELPLDARITLPDTIAFHRTLVNSGASITEINCVRKHFSAVKGGRLALACKGAVCATVLVSDVPEGHLDAISSGPTLPDTSTVDQCRGILARYNLLPQFPPLVREFFASPELPETVKPRDLTERTWTLINSDDLAQSARIQAEKLGFHTIIDNTCDDWNYRAAADYLLDRLRTLRREQSRVCLISVGELTVRSTHAETNGHAIDSGIGGRNQHFALYVATLLNDADAGIAVLSAGSDGIDGNSLAAGAIVNEHTLRDGTAGRHLYLDAEQALREFHSSRFLTTIGATIVTGPTGNNLRDLRILLAEDLR
jgi:glycerate 2-kinase